MSKIIGVTGAFGSGKSTASVFLEVAGFKKIILSQFLEEEAIKRGLEVTRKILQDIGNEWREKYGSEILAQKALEKVSKDASGKTVIDGIRNVSEIEFLRNSGNFKLIAIVSDKKVRFERLIKLKRREFLTWELFENLDSRDAGLNEKETGLQVDKCITLADYSIENNDSEEDFKNKLEELLKNMENKNFVVAIDGPVGSGKGTLSIELAKELNALYLYTGGMYRALALACLRASVDLNDKQRVLDVLGKIVIDVKTESSGPKIILDSQDITDEIFRPEVGNAVPIVAAMVEVREKMVARQKELIEDKRAVVEGRDIATIVAPDAELKIYLTADVDVRAKRRFLQFEEKGMHKTYEEVLEDTKRRDEMDTKREASPLTIVEDAYVIDTTNDSIEDTVHKVKDKLREKGLL